jgi:hypothetical protein
VIENIKAKDRSAKKHQGKSLLSLIMNIRQKKFVASETSRKTIKATVY